MNILRISLYVFLCVIITSCGGEKKKEKSPLTDGKEYNINDHLKKEDKTKIPAYKIGDEDIEGEKTTSKNSTTPKVQLEKAAALIQAASKKELAAVNAASKFKSFCATCHGFTGNANINGAKDLTKSTINLRESVAQIYHGKGLMTPFKGVLKDVEIVALAKYCETLR